MLADTASYILLHSAVASITTNQCGIYTAVYTIIVLWTHKHGGSAIKYNYLLYHSKGTLCGSWSRHCATKQKEKGSIPEGIIWIFRWHNPSSRTMALGSTQPLTEMSTRNISLGVRVASMYGLQPYQLHVLTLLISGCLNILEPSGPVQACNGTALPLPSQCVWKVAVNL
jgi:hypothetical protein